MQICSIWQVRKPRANNLPNLMKVVWSIPPCISGVKHCWCPECAIHMSCYSTKDKPRFIHEPNQKWILWTCSLSTMEHKDILDNKRSRDAVLLAFSHMDIHGVHISCVHRDHVSCTHRYKLYNVSLHPGGTLPEVHLFPVCQVLLWADRRSGNGVSPLSNCGQTFHGNPWGVGPGDLLLETKDVAQVRRWYLCHLALRRPTAGGIPLSPERTKSFKPVHNRDEKEGRIAFVDVQLENKGTKVHTSVCRKTHMDWYLNFDSNHLARVKRCIIQCVRHRAEKGCDGSTKWQEIENQRQVFRANGYPEAVIRRNLRGRPTPFCSPKPARHPPSCCSSCTFLDSARESKGHANHWSEDCLQVQKHPSKCPSGSEAVLWRQEEERYCLWSSVPEPCVCTLGKPVGPLRST